MRVKRREENRTQDASGEVTDEDDVSNGVK
jgi:hypothetical protein